MLPNAIGQRKAHSITTSKKGIIVNQRNISSSLLHIKDVSGILFVIERNLCSFLVVAILLLKPTAEPIKDVLSIRLKWVLFPPDNSCRSISSILVLILSEILHGRTSGCNLRLYHQVWYAEESTLLMRSRLPWC